MKPLAAVYSALVAASATKACEIFQPVGQSLWATGQNHYSPLPRLWRVLLALPTPRKQPLQMRRPDPHSKLRVLDKETTFPRHIVIT